MARTGRDSPYLSIIPDQVQKKDLRQLIGTISKILDLNSLKRKEAGKGLIVWEMCQETGQFEEDFRIGLMEMKILRLHTKRNLYLGNGVPVFRTLVIETFRVAMKFNLEMGH
jgi:hypothetical protein